MVVQGVVDVEWDRKWKAITHLEQWTRRNYECGGDDGQQLINCERNGPVDEEQEGRNLICMGVLFLFPWPSTYNVLIDFYWITS